MYKRFRNIWAVLVACKTIIFVMCVCILGLLFGTFLAGHASTELLSVFSLAAGESVSVIGLAVNAFAPFLLSFILVYLGYPKLMFLIFFFYSFRLGFVSMACYGAFGPGGWLVRLLFQFSDLILFPVFCWFILRNVSGKGRELRSDVAVCFVTFLITAGIDYCFVSPFLAMLIDI